MNTKDIFHKVFHRYYDILVRVSTPMLVSVISVDFANVGYSHMFRACHG